MKFFGKIVCILACVGLLVTSVGVQPVHAASFSVGDPASLIAAINTTNINNSDDVITLSANITLTAINNAQNGLPVILTDSGHSLTIEGAGFTISRFGGAPDFRILQIGPGSDVTIKDLTISGGRNAAGAGIHMQTGSTVILDHVEVSGNNNLNSRGGGVYNYSATLTIQNGSVIGKSGAPNIGYGGGGIFAEGLSPNVAVTILDASTVSYNESPNLAGGGFYLLQDAQLVIQNGSVISNNIGGDQGDYPPFTDPAGGGGIFASANPTITITDSTVSNNIVNCVNNPACGGGGLRGGSSITVTNSTFSNNTVNCNASSPCGGGGIANYASLTITNSTFSGNSTASDGGGIDNHATVNITNSIFSGNSAAYGGGINNHSTLTVTDSTLSGNSATGNGGGIYNQNTLTLTKSTLSGSSANYGGGVYTAVGSIMSAENSTFSGNHATTNGSAIAIGVGACDGGDVSLGSTTIADGTSAGSAIYFEPFICVPGTLTMSNTIVERSGEANAFDFGGSNGFIDNGNNITNDNGVNTPAGVTYHASLGLGSLANNGGATQTIALLTGSPAINAGVNCPGTDQRGVSRPQGAGCDIGAFEVDDTFPTVVSDSLVASYASGAGPSTFTVTFSENVYNPAGDTDPNDVTNPANYLLVEDGINNTFDTVSCAGGLLSDDVQTPITAVTYNAGLFTATVNLSAALPDGSYRLFVCGTTSIFDLALRELNDGLSDYTFNFTVATVTQTASSTTFSALPATGFAPHKVTSLPAQPAHLAYTIMSDIWLEIPSQNIKTNIVGVPQAENKTWDVKWLENNVGWLNGTAFPTWQGNSVLTAHVTNANGLPGPFANIKDLKYGDQLIVHLYGQSYIFEVRASVPVRSGINAYAFQHLEAASYLTLITCQNYDEQTDSYRFRRIVRAVLVDVKDQ